MESLGNKDQGFSVLSQQASCEPVQKPEENSCICKTNQPHKIILTDCRHLMGFCEWSLPLFNTFFTSLEKFKDTNLSSSRTKTKTQTPTPKPRGVVTHHDLEKGERQKQVLLSLPSPFLSHYFLYCRNMWPPWAITSTMGFYCPPPSSLTQHQCLEAAFYIL